MYYKKEKKDKIKASSLSLKGEMGRVGRGKTIINYNDVKNVKDRRRVGGRMGGGASEKGRGVFNFDIYTFMHT